MRAGTMLAIALALAALTASAPSSTVAGERKPRVALAILVGCGEPYDGVLCRGFRRAVREAGVDGRIVVPSTRESFEDMFAALARQRYDLVIAGGTLYLKALADVAPRFPEQRFAILDTRHEHLDGRPKNVQGIVAEVHEASFLAGYLAGRLERARPGRDVAGAVGGIKIPAVDEFIGGFRAGVRHASPRARVLVAYSKTFVNPRRCKAIALRQIAKGAGVLFNVAGGCGLGTLEAAAEKDVWGVGVDADQSFLGRHVMTSVVKNFEPLLRRAVDDVAKGRLRTGGTTALGLREGAAGLGAISASIPKRIRSDLGRVRAQIVAGSIVVPRGL